MAIELGDVGHGPVEGQFLIVVPPTGPGRQPLVEPASGTVTFTPDRETTPGVHEDPVAVVALRPLTFSLDDAGYVVDRSDDDEPLVPWISDWEVTYQIEGAVIPSHTVIGWDLFLTTETGPLNLPDEVWDVTS